MTGLRTIGGVAPSPPVQLLDIDGVTWRSFFNVPPRTNLVINPAWRKTSGTVEVRRNLALNPGYELNTGWTSNNPAVYTASPDTTFFRSGTRSLKSVATTVGSQPTMMSCYNVGIGTAAIPAAAGKAYTVSMYFAHNAAVSSLAKVGYAFLDSSGAVLGVTVYGANVTLPSGDTSFTARAFVTTTVAPAGTTVIRILNQVSRSTGNTVAGDTAWADELLVEEADIPLPYFDGATPPSSDGITYSWAGTPSNSNALAMGVAAQNPGFTAYFATPGIVGWVVSPGVYRILAKKALPVSTLIAFSGIGSAVVPANPGEYFSGRTKIRLVGGASAAAMTLYLYAYNAGGIAIGAISSGVTSLPTSGAWVDAVVSAVNPGHPTAASVRFYYRSGAAIMPAGSIYEFTDALIEKVSESGNPPGPYFDGATPNDSDYNYAWSGLVDYSVSYANP